MKGLAWPVSQPCFPLPTTGSMYQLSDPGPRHSLYSLSAVCADFHWPSLGHKPVSKPVPTPVIFQAQLGTQAWSQSYAHTGVGVPGDLQRKIGVLLKGPGRDSQLTIKCLLHQCRFRSFKFSPVAYEREKGNYQYMPSLRSFFEMLEIRRAGPHPRLWSSLWSLCFSCAYLKYWS